MNHSWTAISNASMLLLETINRRADIALISMGQDGPGTTLIDVAFAIHNIHQPGPDYTVGLAANNSALRKH